jgi:hypothetical protein
LDLGPSATLLLIVSVRRVEAISAATRALSRACGQTVTDVGAQKTPTPPSLIFQQMKLEGNFNKALTANA